MSPMIIGHEVCITFWQKFSRSKKSNGQYERKVVRASSAAPIPDNNCLLLKIENSDEDSPEEIDVAAYC